MTLRVVSLGDSISCGEGVGLALPPTRTWPALLAAALPDAGHLPLATAGARVRDVRHAQLPTAVAAQPHLATLLIGLNDVSHGGFDPDAVQADLCTVVNGLAGTGATVLLARLHDPCRHLPLPSSLRARAVERVAAVNAAVDAARRETSPAAVHLLDLDRIPELRLRRAWAVDRVHPAEAAHAVIAAAAVDVLLRAGLPLTRRPAPDLPSPPGLASETWWAARHGAPWLAQNLREVVFPAVALSR